MTEVTDIKVLGKDDILVAVISELTSREVLDRVLVDMETARKHKNIVLSGMDVYILKDGAKILLKDELNKAKTE